MRGVLSDSRSGLDVTGGFGGVEVAVEDLRRAAARLRAAADRVDEMAPRAWRESPLLSVTGEVQLAGLAHLMAHAARETDEVLERVEAVVHRLRELSVSTGRAAAGYESAERAARAMVSGLHDQAVVAAWAVSETAGRAFGVLDEGEGWGVEVTRVTAPDCVPEPSSVDSLLAGVQTLGEPGSEGGVRVIEVATADGSTTWVVQVPGTHGSWFTGGSVPMDWPANVSLMLRATSASTVAAGRALEVAQAGRAGPRDRVVIVGHSQGGIVAAALASDPGFTRRHRVSHVLTAGSPIDDFPIPDSTQVLSLQHATDPVHTFDVSPPPDRRSWTTVEAMARVGVGAHLTAGAHSLSAYRATAAQVDRSDDASIRHWRTGIAPALSPAPGARPVVHEFRARRRWQNRDS